MLLQTRHLHELRLLRLGHCVPTLLVYTDDIANDPAARQVHAYRRGDRKHRVQGALLQHAKVTAERQEAWNLGSQHGPARVDGRRLNARDRMEDGVAFTVDKDAADGARLLRMKHCRDSAVNLSVDRRTHCTRWAHVARVSLATCPTATRSTVSTRSTHNTYTKHTQYIHEAL